MQKTWFITGANRGLGLEIAKAVLRAGDRVVAAGRQRETVNAALGADGERLLAVELDVTRAGQAKAAVEATVARFGGIDVLISGAAGNFPAPALGISPNGFKSVVDIDLLGSFHVLRAAFPYLNKPGASIVNISAPQAYVPMELQMHVCAAKAGVDMVTRVAAMEWAAAGVRVNSVTPGPIDGTEGMNRLAPNEAMRELVRDSVPLGQFGAVDDIANACLWLASAQARYVTGVVLPVDGGWSLGGLSASSAGMKKAFMAGGGQAA